MKHIHLVKLTFYKRISVYLLKKKRVSSKVYILLYSMKNINEEHEKSKETYDTTIPFVVKD